MMTVKQMEKHLKKIQRVLLKSDMIMIECKEDRTRISNGHFIFSLPTAYMWAFDQLPEVHPYDRIIKHKGGEWNTGSYDLSDKIQECLSDSDFTWGKVLPITYESCLGGSEQSFRPFVNRDTHNLTFITEDYYQLFRELLGSNPNVYNKDHKHAVLMYDHSLANWIFSVMILPCNVSIDKFIGDMAVLSR